MGTWSYILGLPYCILGVLTWNPPVLPRWAAWLTSIIRIVVIFVVFRRNLAPYLLARVSRHIRARSISLRSIRGLYFRRAGRTWRVKRIGWSLHPFSKYRISVIVEGLQLEIGDQNGSHMQASNRKSTTGLGSKKDVVFRSFSLVLHIISVGLSYLGHLLRSFSVVSHLQIGVSSLIITSSQLFVRYLAPLIKEFDFEVDSIIVSSNALSHSCLVVNGLKFGLAIDLCEDNFKSDIHEDSSKRGTRFSMGTGRLWERVWGSIEVSASLNLTVNEVIGILTPNPAISFDSGSYRGHKQGTFSGEYIRFAHFPDGFVASMSVQMLPRLQNVKPRSLKTSLKVSEVEIFMDELRKLLHLHSRNRQVTQPMIDILPSQQYSASPQSPVVVALSRFTRGRAFSMSAKPSTLSSQNTATSKLSLPYLFVLDSADVLLSCIKISQSHSGFTAAGRTSYVFSLNDFTIHAGSSDGKLNLLHRKWLGVRSCSEIDDFAYSFTCTSTQIELNATHRPLEDTCHKVFSLQQFRFDTVSHRLPWFTKPGLLYGDPNDPFIGGEILISSVQYSENIEVLRSYIDESMIKKADFTPGSRSLFHIPSLLPRFDFHLSCGNIFALLKSGDESSGAAINVCSEGFSAHIDASFHHMKRQPLSTSTSSLHTDAEVFLRPLAIYCGRLSTLLGRVDVESSSPIISLDTIELSLAGRTGCLVDNDVVVLEPKSSLIWTNCVTDGVAIELWNEEAISSFSRILTFIQNPATGTKARSRKAIVNVDLWVHLAIACLTVVATSKDMNPTCDLDISRGMEFRTGLAIGCHFGRTHYIRQSSFARHLPDIPSRRLLGIPEDNLANLGTSYGIKGQEKIVSFGCLLWQFTCRTAAATPFEYGAYSIYESDHHIDLIHIPRATFHGATYRLGNIGDNNGDKVDLSAHIRHIGGRLDLLNLYSFLLAVKTFRALVPPQSMEIDADKRRIGLQISFQLENVHLDCHLPLRQRLFIQVVSLSVESPLLGVINADCRSIVGYVPSLQFGGLWEELLRVRSITMDFDKNITKGLQMAADGLRVSIPHSYILSDLILDVILTVKAMKHLIKIAKLGLYIPMPQPPPEEAKQLPMPIGLYIGTLTFEAADSPFEAELGLIWRTGSRAQKVRQERELAFEAKLKAVMGFSDGYYEGDTIPQSDLPYHFTSKQTTSISDARKRLNMVHAMSWISYFSRQKSKLADKEHAITRHLHKEDGASVGPTPLPIIIKTFEKVPPLFRVIFSQLSLALSRPVFVGGYATFLQDLGNMPISTEYSLLVPLHLVLTINAARLMIRDYQLPLINIPSNQDSPSLEFVTDLIVAEEMGTAKSVQWFDCPIVPESTIIAGSRSFTLNVPKTIMPVKSYAKPNIKFHTSLVTEFTWGVSYHPAIQDIMRVIETLTTPPQDNSPPIGFWDKLRLVFHWRIEATFRGGVRLHFKGSRDPYHITGEGAGFDFDWDGDVLLRIGYLNSDQELIQLYSESMTVSIPDHVNPEEEGNTLYENTTPHIKRKVCAQFSGGIRWGIGIVLERTCDDTCLSCTGDPFNRQCRFFTFKPHYEVKLRCDTQPSDDSYIGFRSNFIHFSTSLTSPLRQGATQPNSFHLTPKTFAHFWSWWHLFDSALSLPIRQGRLFPESRPPTKKFGKHLATIKYRIIFSSIYIAHVYPLDTGDAWAAGESHFVGVKAFVERFQADMHQTLEETVVRSSDRVGSKKIRHKPFSSVDVVITSLDLRALFGTFLEPGKTAFPLHDTFQSGQAFWEDLESIPLTSAWVDKTDFVEVDWMPLDREPKLYMHQAASCPRFVYFKRTPLSDLSQESITHTKSKFGDEQTHYCLMGTEPCALEIQLEYAIKRLDELRATLPSIFPARAPKARSLPVLSDTINIPESVQDTVRMVRILERYIDHLSSLSAQVSPTASGFSKNSLHDLYDVPADITLPEEMGDFSNVYQVHGPKIFLNNATRDLLRKYYLASRARRGFEYHMSTRAVKFIRDQALTVDTNAKEKTVKSRQRAGGAHTAAQAVRRMLTGEDKQYPKPGIDTQPFSANIDPLYGWNRGVTERKAHLCLLLKPQIVLHNTRAQNSKLVLIANHVILRNYGILDTANASDPVSGFIMQRNFASVDSLQVFQPPVGKCVDHLPLEVFVDIRCNSRDFQRLVPQTHATLRYDKFNRLRLRNDATTTLLSSGANCDQTLVDHLYHETDLIQIDVPRFSFSADSTAFKVMGDIVGLLLFSDPAHKARITQLETMLFSYDFTDFESASKVISNLQSRIRRLTRSEETYSFGRHQIDDLVQRNLLASKAHIFKLSEELNLIFDAIRLAQDNADEKTQEKKSALRVDLSSSEISWLMLDSNHDLLAKLAVRGIRFSWLSRQDGSTNSTLSLVDLQAFDGSPDALLPEILSKYEEPANHHMIRRGLFVEAQWSILAPVGGISIYDHFKLELHPVRLALETQLGNRLIGYFLPNRRDSGRMISRKQPDEDEDEKVDFESLTGQPIFILQQPEETDGVVLDSPTTSSRHQPKEDDGSRARLVSRSFTNLAASISDHEMQYFHAPGLPKSISSTDLVRTKISTESHGEVFSEQTFTLNIAQPREDGDAFEMRHRSVQKTFVHAEIPSIHVLLSIMKGRGFLIRDARLRTHNLEWHNRTCSFETLFNQFIPSDPSLRGWMKVALQQPVFSVGGVVKELITKAQWGRLGKEMDTLSRQKTSPRKISSPASSSKSSTGLPISDTRAFPSVEAGDNEEKPTVVEDQSNHRSRSRVVSTLNQPRQRSTSRSRVKGLFKRPKSRKTGDFSDVSANSITPPRQL